MSIVCGSKYGPKQYVSSGAKYKYDEMLKSDCYMDGNLYRQIWKVEIFISMAPCIPKYVFTIIKIYWE